ncbi:MAG: DUF1206 domain-containing protein [Nocardioidaceae bacterium]
MTAQEDTAEEVDRNARNSSTLEWAVRAGLLGYGLIHLLVAWVAIRLVYGGGGGRATSKGALAQLADSGPGRFVLAVMALGFAALAIWQVFAGLFGYRDREGLSRQLQRFGALCRVVTYGYFATVCTQLTLAGPSGHSKSPDSMTAKVLTLPAGLFIVLGVGLTAAGIGIGLVIFGLRKDFLGQLDHKARNTTDRRVPIIVLGQVGYIAKGIAFVVIGGLLCWAAVTRDPNKSGGLDSALKELLGHAVAVPAIVVAGVGIGAFGLYLMARSWHLDEDSLTS